MLQKQAAARLSALLDNYKENPDKIPLNGLQDFLQIELVYQLTLLNKKLNGKAGESK